MTWEKLRLKILARKPFSGFAGAQEFGRYCAFSSFSFCIRESDIVLNAYLVWKNLEIWKFFFLAHSRTSGEALSVI